MADTTLTIGELAGRAGVNTSAIRYYERIGVLPRPAREGGRRRYGADDVRRLEMLGVAKRAGLRLEDARVLLERYDAGEPLYVPLRELAARRLTDVEALLTRVSAMQAALLAASDCSCETLDRCALFLPAAGPA